MKSTELIKNIDWTMLEKQKQTLFKVIENTDDIDILEDLEGIIMLINNIQDHAVDDLGFSEEVVFIQNDND